MARTPTKKSLCKECDDIFRDIHRLAGKCAVCGSVKGLQVHHLRSRRSHSLRHILSNGILLCASHHNFDRNCSAHMAPIGFAEWLRVNHPGQHAWATRYHPPQKLKIDHYVETRDRLLRMLETPDLTLKLLQQLWEADDE